ncbi:hypothetical protein [Amycolatopsis sp. NPDC004625]|uniref:hypothetical protein n=1 Tax=Amycolatopsis sp. NPDC004625 TaxID=3154670 RepID=UPI0033A5144E
MTLALNVAEPLIAGEVGKALFDAVGPLLLIGWSEVGPVLLQALAAVPAADRPAGAAETTDSDSASAEQREGVSVDAELLERARHEDRRHRELYQRPISAESLRKVLGVGAERSRTLVTLVRAERSISA